MLPMRDRGGEQTRTDRARLAAEMVPKCDAHAHTHLNTFKY